MRTGGSFALCRSFSRDRMRLWDIEHMLARLEPPLPREADAVEWRCV